jgi:DNA-directed RNA polymerase subunit omega
LDTLVKKVDSKYTLVVAAAKRARELTNGKQTVIDTASNKPVSVALQEIARGRLKYERTKIGIK